MDQFNIYELFNKACKDASSLVIKEIISKPIPNLMEYVDSQGNHPLSNLLGSNDIIYGEYGNSIDFELFSELVSLMKNVDIKDSFGCTILTSILNSIYPNEFKYAKILFDKGAKLENCINKEEILIHLVVANNYGLQNFFESFKSTGKPNDEWYDLIDKLLAVTGTELDSEFKKNLLFYAQRNNDDKMIKIIDKY